MSDIRYNYMDMAMDDLNKKIAVLRAENAQLRQQLAEVERRTWERCVTLGLSGMKFDRYLTDYEQGFSDGCESIADAIRREFKEGE